jgi:hypothetical protein
MHVKSQARKREAEASLLLSSSVVRARELERYKAGMVEKRGVYDCK